MSSSQGQQGERTKRKLGGDATPSNASGGYQEKGARGLGWRIKRLLVHLAFIGPGESVEYSANNNMRIMFSVKGISSNRVSQRYVYSSGYKWHDG